MPEPFDSSVSQNLAVIDSLIIEQHFPDLMENVWYHGTQTMQLLDFAGRALSGDGEYVHTQTQVGDSVRVQGEALADPGAPDAFATERVKIRFNERSASSSDFTRFFGVLRTDHYALKGLYSDGAVADLVDRLVMGLKDDFKFKMAVCLRGRRSGTLGLVNGTKTLNDANIMANATAYSTGSSFRCYIDGGSIAAFRPGGLYDCHDSSGNILADGLRCTDIEPGDTTNDSVGSAGFELTTFSTVADTSGVVDNGVFSFHGTRNQSMWGIEEWLRIPSSGESFIGGVDRLSSSYRYLLPNVFRSGASSAKISKTHLDEAGDGMAFRMDKPVQGYQLGGNPRLLTSLRNQYDSALFVQVSAGAQSERTAHMGATNLAYQHPSLGQLVFNGDPLKPADSLELIVKGDFKIEYYGSKAPEILPGERGNWSRMQSTIPGRGKTLFYEMQNVWLGCPFCYRPKRQLAIQNLTP